jgi:MFS family permease
MGQDGAAGQKPNSVFATPGFLRYFAGSVTCDSGATLTGFLLSIIAVISFEASAAQMGLLVVAQRIPVVLFALFAGVLIDRLAVRTLLIATTTIMAGLLVAGPLFLGFSGGAIEHLYLLAFLIGTLAMILDIGLTTLLSLMIPPSDLVRANANLSVVRHAASAAMPTIGGALIKLVQPILALFTSTILYALAAMAFVTWRGQENRQLEKKAVTARAVLKDILEGLKVLLDVKILRAVIASSCAGAFSFGIWTALLVLTLATRFDLTPFTIGIVVSLESLALVAGSSVCPQVSRILGPGRTLILGNMVSAAGIALTALGLVADHLGTVVAGALIMGAATPLYSINQISIRQAITPPDVMGRANASRRFLVFSFLPLGALAGGYLASGAGLAAGFGLSALAMAVAALIPLWSPLRSRDLTLGSAG